jgi:hypothetical protein
MKFLDIDLTEIKISLCGNYGDPIYHPDLPGLVHDFKQRGATIDLITNGSHRKTSWWKELLQELSEVDSITFSIDGVPENFAQYRVNGDWTTIQDAIKQCVLSPCKTIWKFIPFSYNENSIEQARQLSQDLGIDQFLVSPSSRFDEQTLHFKPSNELTGTQWHSQQNWKQTVTTKNLIPKCHDGREHFILADGHYMPCCYVGDHRFYYKTQFGKNIADYNIANTTFTKLLGEESVKSFYQTITDQPPNVCQFNCPGTTPVDQ